MPKQNRRWLIGAVALLLLVTTSACSIGSLIGGSGVKLPDRKVPVSSEAAAAAKNAIISGAAKGQIRLTESQFTSYVTELIAENTGKENVLANVTVWFDPGKVYLKATISGDQVPVTGVVAMAGTGTIKDGRLQIKIEQASINNIGVPGSVLDVVNSQLNDILTNSDFADVPAKSVTIKSKEIVIGL